MKFTFETAYLSAILSSVRVLFMLLQLVGMVAASESTASRPKAQNCPVDAEVTTLQWFFVYFVYLACFILSKFMGMTVITVRKVRRIQHAIDKNEMPRPPSFLLFVLVALDYSEVTVKVNGDREETAVEISVKEDNSSRTSKSGRTIPPFLVLFVAAVLGYSEVTINVDDAENGDVELKVWDVHLRKEKGRAAYLFMHLFVAAIFGYSEVSFSVEDERVGLDLPRSKVGINVRGERGRTALHRAVIHKNKQRVESLLIQGADRTIQDEDGFTPYQTALVLGVAELVQSFLAPTSKDALQKEALAYLAAHEDNSTVLDSVLSHASQSTKPGLVQAMLEYEDEHGNTALHVTTEKIEPEALKKLIQYVRRPEKANKEGKTALDIVLERRKDVNSVARILAEKSGVAVDLENGMSLQ